MSLSKKILGIIPARGGSKGVVRKNIRPVAGKPLIYYAIRSARESALITDFIVSTDDKEIRDAATMFGAEVLERPSDLSKDTTPMLPVVRHVLEHMEKEKKRQYDYCVLIQPTAPLRRGKDIDAAVGLLESTGADSIVSVYQVVDSHPARMYRLEHDRLIPYAPEPAGSLRQDLPPVYHRNGAVYAFRCDMFRKMYSFYGNDCRPYIMSRERSVNIDEEIDLVLADHLLRQQEKGH